MQVLVIEDDSAVREILGFILQSFDHEAILVENGPSALQHLQNSWPDALMLDLILENSTGEQIYQQIHTHFGRTPPTIVLSAAKHGKTRAQSLGNALFLEKPFSLDALENALKKLPLPATGAA